jgi:S-adenosyl methyltransferase
MTRRSRIQPGSITIATGLPVANNTHEVAQSLAPESRIVYVDNDRCKSGCAHDRD